MGDKQPVKAADAAPAKMHFDARVEPFWFWHRSPKKILGIFDADWKKRRRLEALVRAIGQGLAAQGVEAGDWHQKDGETVCNLRMDRLGVLQDLRVFAASLEKQSATEIYEGSVESRYRHLIRNRDRNAYYIPVDFPDPLMVLEHETGEFMPVGSSPSLLRETELLNKELRIEKTFKLKAMVDFFQAGENDIIQFDKRFGHDPQFWLKFSFVMLQKLAKKSVESGFPIIFQ